MLQSNRERIEKLVRDSIFMENTFGNRMQVVNVISQVEGVIEVSDDTTLEDEQSGAMVFNVFDADGTYELRVSCSSVDFDSLC